jgi:hypothetical protein
MSEMSVVKVDEPIHGEIPERPDYVRSDEPAFPTIEYQQLYRELVEKMKAESNRNPSTSTIVGLAIETFAREHVVRLIGDQGETRAHQLLRDRRMLSTLRLITDSAQKSSGAGEGFNQFVMGLIPVVMGVIDSRVGHDPVLAVKLKEDIGAELSAYVGRALP